MSSSVFSMFPGFWGHADKNHICTVLIYNWPFESKHNADMVLNENEFDNLLQCSRMSESRD